MLTMNNIVYIVGKKVGDTLDGVVMRDVKNFQKLLMEPFFLEEYWTESRGKKHFYL